MSNINIAGLVAVDDPSYRYKMPKVQAKIEGRGNGIKTVLVNIVELAGALKREAPEVTKFFGCELGAQTIYTLETGYERAIVNGAHSEMDLQKSLSRYIEFFVLCKSCRLPETYYKIKSGIVSQNCLACGCKFDCDLNHKLTTFILAQHKKAKELKAKTEKADKKEKGDKNVLDDDKDKKDKKEKKKDKDKDKEKSEKVGGEEKADKKKKKKKELVEGGAGEGEGGDETEAMAAGNYCTENES
jgi:translation initiation factor 5